MPFAKPLARTREYVEILRDDLGAATGRWPSTARTTAAARPGGTGLGKPLKSSIHPLREEIPIYLAAEGPKNIALAAEIGDGWMALLLLAPRTRTSTGRTLDEGFAREGAPPRSTTSRSPRRCR